MGAVVVVIYASWIYNYLCNQCLSPLMLWVRISTRARCTTLCDKVCQWLATVLWFSPGPSVSSTNKINRHDITEILLKVALNTIKQTNINDSDWNHFVLPVLCEFGYAIFNIKLLKFLIFFHLIFIQNFQKLSLNLLVWRTEILSLNLLV